MTILNTADAIYLGAAAVDRAYLGADVVWTPGAGNNYAAEVLADSPLAYWRLGEASGTTAADSTSNGRNGTYNGPTLGVPGAIGDGNTAASFDGTNDNVTVPSTGLDAGNVFSVEAWVKGSKSTGDRTIVSRWHGASTQRWVVGVNSATGIVTVFVRTSGYPSVSHTTDVLDGAWHHVAFVRTGTQQVLYVDKVAASMSDSGTVQAGANLAIGSKVDNSEWWAGQVDEVAVYGTALSSTRVAAHYDAR